MTYSLRKYKRLVGSFETNLFWVFFPFYESNIQNLFKEVLGDLSGGQDEIVDYRNLEKKKEAIKSLLRKQKNGKYLIDDHFLKFCFYTEQTNFYFHAIEIVDQEGMGFEDVNLEEIGSEGIGTEKINSEEEYLNPLRLPYWAILLIYEEIQRRERIKDVIKNKFLSIKTKEDLADLLKIPLNKITYTLYKLDAKKKYRTFEIPKKSNGSRRISAPNDGLLFIQKKLATVLCSIFQSRFPVHGFSTGKSVATNACLHVKRKSILNIDIKDFFPSINFGRVRGRFLAPPYNLPPEVSTLIANICCHKNQLPQGAPTSPIISNMICSKMDGELVKLSQKYGLRYSRYCDDLTFSSKEQTITPDVHREIIEIINKEGFRVNPDKTRLLPNNFRQTVTGLIVNEKLNVPRKYIRKIRSMLFWIEKNGVEGAKNKYLEKECCNVRFDKVTGRRYVPHFLSTLQGKISFIGMVRGKNDDLYLKLKKKFDYLVKEIDISSLPPIFLDHEPNRKNEASPKTELYSTVSKVNFQKSGKPEKKNKEVAQYFEKLNLDPAASIDELDRAYTHLSKIWDPDNISSGYPRLKERAKNKMKEIKNAYEEILKYLESS